MKRPATFALIGAAGYIAPRHMKAIKDVGGDLRVAYDPHDAVGILDSYFPDAAFFVEFERYDRYVSRLAMQGEAIDYVSVCSPNYLHDAHVRHALRSGSHAICEKPLVLNPWNLDALADIERRSGRTVSTILQLRLHPSVIALKREVAAKRGRVHDVSLSYVTPRGNWYQTSWKGDVTKSGGIATNIGVHFFDMLIDVFGPVERSVLYLSDSRRAAGHLTLRAARVSWFLSIAAADLPAGAKSSHRSILVDGEAFTFSDGFADLHTLSYAEILAGRGFGIETVRPSIELVSALRQTACVPPDEGLHPAARPYVSA